MPRRRCCGSYTTYTWRTCPPCRVVYRARCSRSLPRTRYTDVRVLTPECDSPHGEALRVLTASASADLADTTVIGRGYVHLPVNVAPIDACRRPSPRVAVRHPLRAKRLTPQMSRCARERRCRIPPRSAGSRGSNGHRQSEDQPLATSPPIGDSRGAPMATD